MVEILENYAGNPIAPIRRRFENADL